MFNHALSESLFTIRRCQRNMLKYKSGYGQLSVWLFVTTNKPQSQNRDTYRSPTQGCNVSSCFYAKICSLLTRRWSSQPVQRVYWPENVIYWPEQWRTACVMRYGQRHKLQSFRREWDFCMYPYSVLQSCFFRERTFMHLSLITLKSTGKANVKG